MADRFELSVFLLLLATLTTPSGGFLLSNEDSPGFLDRVLQVVWEPSSLIRMWVGLDQLYNIALSWKGVAKTLSSLPFGGEGRDGAAHVMIQQPRSLKYHKPSVASQWDRFKEIYASSNLSPILSNAGQAHNPYGHSILAGNNLVPLLYQQVASIAPGPHHPHLGPAFALDTAPSGHQDFLLGLSGTSHLDRHSHLGSMMVSNHPRNLGVVQMNPAGQSGGGGLALDTSPERRLTALLGLLKTLGYMHAQDVPRETAQEPRIK